MSLYDVSVAPAGFRTFKDSVQEAWVSKRGAGTAAASDERLFLAGNVALGVAAAAMAAVVSPTSRSRRRPWRSRRSWPSR